MRERRGPAGPAAFACSPRVARALAKVSTGLVSRGARSQAFNDAASEGGRRTQGGSGVDDAVIRRLTVPNDIGR